MTTIAPRDLALLLGVNVVWGLNLVVSRYGLQELPPVLFTALRFGLFGLILVPMLRIRRGQMSALVVAAVLSGGLNFALMIVGLALAENVSSVAIASQLGVPFTTLLSIALLGEVVHWRRWTGIVLSFAGVVVMGFDPHVTDRWLSLALVIASQFVGALGVITVKRLRDFRPLELQAWFAWINLPLLIGLTLALERPGWDTITGAGMATWGAVAFTALGASLFGHTGFYYLVQRYPITSVAPVTVLSPVFSVVFSVLLLGDVLTPKILAGGACTLAGVLIITLRERRIVDVGS